MSKPEESLVFGRFLASPPPGEEVVVSGIAGRFPESDHMYELRDNLLNGVDMVTEDERRWKKEDPRIPQRLGKIKDLSKFDCSFFGVHSKQANCMCPMLRSLMERTYEAIVDAGINPASLKGTRTGVYLGSCFSETERVWIFDSLEDNSYPMTGSNRPMFAARISHWLGVTGPSYTTDSACSSALFAVNYAYHDLRLGVVDFAVVGGSNLCLEPFTSLQFAGLGVLSAEGRVKAFDQDADGYVRSEAMAIAFLQRAKDARRIYCTVVHSKVNCDGYKPEGITFPATQVHEMLFREFYQECGINPATVDYMEAHATGTRVGDPEELNAVEHVFCKNRAIPLPIGSNKSNLGHSEPASGLCSLGKVVLAMETGIIAANLNFKTHKEAVGGFKTGKFKVITENTPLPGDLIAVNSFGFGGANAHLLLRRNPKEKQRGGAARDLLPRLVVASGRTEEAVRVILDSVRSTPVDTEFISLLHEVHATNIPGHCYRGFTLLLQGEDNNNNNTQIQFYDKHLRPLWLVSSGMGDEWLGIGRSLLQVPKFAAAIQKCDHALRFKDINIMKMIVSDGSNMADDVISNVVTVTAIQLALVDILSCVGITPDVLLGHSTGELVSAYADGCLTIQQAILVAYHFAAVSSNQELLKCLQQIISNPKPRSKRWLTTCMSGGDSNTSRSRLASPEYFTACLLGSTPVENMARLLPDDALVIALNPIEVHKSRTRNVTIFSLPSNSENNGVNELFVILGKLYTVGIPLRLSQLYPAVQYPVSRGTAMISPLVRWEYSQSWAVYGEQQVMNKCERMVSINVADQANEFYTGHVIDGRNLYPATGYLLLVWETFSQMLGPTAMISVVFEDVRFLRATTLPPEGKVVFVISVQKDSGHFEVEDGGTAIVTGRVRRLRDSGQSTFLELPLPEPADYNDHIDMEARDIYKELRLRGYNYSGVFRGLVRVNFGASRGVISWSDNWVGFMDTMLQMRILSRDTRSLYVPTGIDRMVIDLEKHDSQLAQCAEEMTLPIYAWNNLDIVRAGGVEIQHMAASSITRRKPLGDPVLERYQFIPHSDFSESTLTVDQALRVCVHLVLENHLGVKVQVTEVCPPERELLARDINNILEDLPLIEASVSVIAPHPDSRVGDLGPQVQILKQSKLPADHSSLLVVTADIIHNTKLLDEAVLTLADDGCILARELLSVDLNSAELNSNLQVIVDRTVGKERFLLLRKQRQRKPCPPHVIRVTENDLSWLPALQTAVRDVKDPQRVVLVAQDEPTNGVLGLFNCIRKEPGGDFVRCFFILDPEAPQFKPCLPLYAKQLEKDLAVNVLQDGQWGSFRHLLLEPLPKTTALHGYNNVLQRGDLSSLTWLEGPFTNLNDIKNSLHVYYSALNFRDIMMSTGKLSPDSITEDRTKMEVLQGFEFSGRDPKGARVMGMSSGCSLTNILQNETGLVWRVPDQWSLEEAATVPIVYSTVIYALKVEGRLERGDTVLIHAGSGGVGQAAINYCLFHGCTVYTTVGSREKRDFIKKHFPQITDDHIGNSRDLTFEEFILRQTKQRGVDLILNSLAEEKLQASIRCLAKRGHFLEIGKFDMANNNPIAMDMFSKDQSFHSVMLDLFFSAPTQEKILLRNLLQEAIEEGSVKPLARTVFDMNNVEKAFRFMAAGRHIGKVLVKIRPEEGDMWVKPTPQPMVVKPRFHCDPQLTYVILGGLGGFGLELADWLVLRGARRLVLTSRRGISTGYQSSRVLTWRRYGVTVMISTAEVSTEEGVTKLLTEANAIGPVGGIFNLAVVLRDALLENQTEESFLESFRGKALATHHLDVVSRRMCPRLKNFVVFSSVSCGRGNAGQTNYGMSNSIMERMCEARTRDGLPGLAIQWGAVGEVGLVAEMQEEQHELVIGGTLQQRISSCLEVMDDFLKQPHPVVASMVVAEKRALAGKFGNIIECVANILGIRDLKTVSGLSSLTELGMDSMMAVEVKQVLEREFEVFLTPQEIRSLTIKQLQELSTTDNKEDTHRTANEERLQGPSEKAKREQFIFNFYGSKEMASQILLPLASPKKRLTDCPVFMVPGMEGTATTMEQLSKNVMAPCVGAQLCYRNSSTTIPDMASHLLQHIRKQLPPRKPFTLVGHSFGGLVALEMAIALEAEGFLGQVVLLDASPEFTYELVKQHILKDAKDEDSRQILQLYRILHFIAPTFEHSMDEFTAALKQRSSLQERIEWVLEFAPEVDRGYQYAIVNAILTHINAIVNYSWPQGRRVQSAVTLIRPTNTLIKMEGDCGLSKICQNKVVVHFVEGDHTSMLQNSATADIINQVLQG